ncbi:MAG: aminotransferase class V-fold PLP-dependent enzyme [Eubacteriaceae bacterium]|nr:aminotransferase class V-fold PLP-dependent enzyme [Eubacteriaceae bacterium]
MKVYLDNASTSYPKAPDMVKAMTDFMENIGCNINRGGYENSYGASGIVTETREMLCELFNYPDSKNVIFTPNVTYSLNYIIKGLLKRGDHVLVSSMEHNAVMRPLVQMSKEGVAFNRIPCNEKGELQTEEIEKMIRPDTKAIIMTHSSNVCGTLMPIKAVGQICKKHNIKFIVDAAQTAGAFNIDMLESNIDALAFTGHKSLLGPQGIGGFIVRDEIASQMVPLITGGTGSMSESEEYPEFLPDKFEPGTMNIPGIFGLNEALKYLKSFGIANILEKELMLTEMMLDGLKSIPNLKLIGLPGKENRAPVISITSLKHDNAWIGYELDSTFGIMTRVGLHCSPSSHKTLNTYPSGTVRFSINHFNTQDEISYTIESLKKLLK